MLSGRVKLSAEIIITNQPTNGPFHDGEFIPVIGTSEKAMGAKNCPEWSRVTSAGIFTISTIGCCFGCHYHDCNEYWLVSKGRAKVLSEGHEYFVKSGDILCTQAGEEHDILEIYEDLEEFWFEDDTSEEGRIGHLHKSEEKAKGHDVPALPLLSDFPQKKINWVQARGAMS